MAAKAVGKFPTDRRGTQYYNAAMKAIEEAGARFRPSWDLVDGLQAAFDIKDPKGRSEALAATYSSYFGHHGTPTSTVTSEAA